MVTIGLVANVYNEANALPGWIETHLPFFDDVRVLHAGPGGGYSNDGTVELLEKWNIPTEFCAIDDGFGMVRTRALRMSPCDYIMLLDADERFYPLHRSMVCEGNGTPQHEVDWILQSYDFRGVNLPNWENINRLGSELNVTAGLPCEQGNRLRQLLAHHREIGSPLDAVATVRRHWHDLAMRRPTQHWKVHPDWQLRIARRSPDIMFDPGTRMHERLVGVANVYHADWLFFDHFHFTFKRMEQQQRAHDVAIYDAIHEGKEPPSWKAFQARS